MKIFFYIIIAACNISVALNSFAVNNALCISPKSILDIKIAKCELPIGIGDIDQRILGIKVLANSSSSVLKKISFSCSGTTDINDIAQIKLYYTYNKNRFVNAELADKLASINNQSGTITFEINQSLITDSSFFWITYDVSQNAKEGNVLNCNVESIYIDETSHSVSNPIGARTILLSNSLLFSCGDYGSKHYRIPAIVTANDGSLVTATDKRWNNHYDLDNDIDILIRRSGDNGQTWSSPKTIAGEGTTTGYGDAALCVDKKSGKIFCLMASGPGLWNSTATNPIRIMQCISADNGISWSNPTDITNMIYGSECNNQISKNWRAAFVASGSFCQFANGRLAAVIAVRRGEETSLDNFMIYSDNLGQTWNISTNVAKIGGDEAKLVELAGGTILMSIRNKNFRYFCKSNDYGITWQPPFQTQIIDPACNGDIIRYTSIDNGYDKNRILHSIPYSNKRKNVSVLISYDESETWTERKSIYTGESAYSSLCVLNDGTIGIYYEVGEYDIYQMYFSRFSLSWLTDNKDFFVSVNTSSLKSLDDKIEAFPNPTCNIINVKYKNNSKYLFKIIDFNGNVLMNGQNNSNYFKSDAFQINIENLNLGAYILQIDDGYKSDSIKFVKDCK